MRFLIVDLSSNVKYEKYDLPKSLVIILVKIVCNYFKIVDIVKSSRRGVNIVKIFVKNVDNFIVFYVSKRSISVEVWGRDASSLVRMILNMLKLSS